MSNPERSFLTAYIVAAAAGMALVFALAVIVDPYNIFGVEFFRPILLTTRNDKLRLLRETPQKPDIIILGSSRVFKMDPARIEERAKRSVFNASVSFARAEDHYAMTKYIVQDLGITPKQFIVGVNLGEFNYEETEAETINNSGLRKYVGINRAHVVKTQLQTLKKRFNQRYLRDIFVSLAWNSRGFPNPTINFDERGGQIFNRTNAPDPKAVSITMNLAEDLFRGMTALNPARIAYIEKFLAFAKEKNITVTVFLLPFPAAARVELERTTSYPALINEFLSAADRWKKDYGIAFFDFSTPEKFNGSEDDFDDSTHPSHRNLDFITDHLFPL